MRLIAEIVPDFNKSTECVDNENITAFNFNHPSAFDTDLMVEHLISRHSSATLGLQSGP